LCGDAGVEVFDWRCCCCRYLPGQHFLAHEDAFPALLATANGFQRHATLLLYLNDVAQVRQLLRYVCLQIFWLHSCCQPIHETANAAQQQIGVR
jgi:hypothetical protein